MRSLYAHDPFLAVQAALAAPWLDGPMALSSIACEGWALALVAVAYVLLRRRPARESLATLLGLGAALLLAGVAGRFVKNLWNVPRPLAVLGPDAVRVLLEPLYLRSLPSGHAASAAAVAAFAVRRHGWRAWPLVLLALAGGTSRVYVGAHWVLDVLAGWTIGALAGLAVDPLWSAARAAAGRAALAVRRILPEVLPGAQRPGPLGDAAEGRRSEDGPLPGLRALVCVPTYNERENLSPLVDAVRAAAPGVDVLVIDDGSPDGTGALADQLAARDRRVHVLHRPRKEGLGKAYLAGFAWALERGYDLVLEMDADFSHDPRTVPALLARAREADLVLGSRYVPGGAAVGWGPLRRLLSRGGSAYARMILGIPVRDLTGGFKCFRREVLEAIDLPSATCTGYAFQIELTYRALRAGFRVAEVPIRFEDRRVGRSKMSPRVVLEAVWKVWTMRLEPAPRPRAGAARQAA
jgi:dolichol-phosphate mannosyltransferase